MKSRLTSKLYPKKSRDTSKKPEPQFSAPAVYYLHPNAESQLSGP